MQITATYEKKHAQYGDADNKLWYSCQHKFLVLFALETEKRALANTIESNFYTKGMDTKPISIHQPSDDQVNLLASQLAQDPQLLQQAMQILLAGAQGTLSSKNS